MEKLPEAGIEALPGLLEALKDPHHGVRRIAVRNIGRLESAAVPYISDIAKLLQDPNAVVKQAAAWALGETGVLATPLILQALKDPDCKPTAERAIRKIYPAIFNSVVFSPAQTREELDISRSKEFHIHTDSTALTQALAHLEYEIRFAGIYCLGQLNEPYEGISQLEDLLLDDSAEVQLGAAATIGRQLEWHLDPTEHPKLFASLLYCLKSKNPQVTSGAINALASLDESAVAFLSDQLLSSEVGKEAKQGILRALPDLDEIAGSSVPAIRASLVTDHDLYEDALIALGKLCKGHPETQQLFLEALDDPQQQLAAVKALEYMGGSACFAGKPLLQLLEARDDELRRATQISLAAVGKEITPLLVEELKVGSPNRESILAVISLMGASAAGSVYELITILQGDEANLASQAATTLGRIGPCASEAVEPLAAALHSGNQRLASKAAFALGMLGSEAVPALLFALSSATNPQAKVLVIDALGNVTPPNDSTILPIARSLLDDDPSVQLAAVTVLVNLGAPAAAGMKIYEKALMHHNRTVRSHAAKVLSSLGPDAVSAIPALLTTLKLGRIPARKLAALALAKLAGLSPLIVPALQRMLRSHDKDIVVAACIALGGIGRDASPAARGLIKVLGHRKAKHNPDYRLVSGSVIREATTALVKIGPEAVPAIIDSLRHRNVNILDELLSLLPLWGAHETSVVSKPRTRRYIVRALQEIGQGAEKAVPILCQVIQDKDSDLRARAEVALSSIGNIKEQEIRTLAKALQSRNNSVRSHTASVLGTFGRISRLAVPGLIGLLNDKDPGVRKKAIVSLGKIGPASRGSVGPLLKLLVTTDLEQAHLVAEAVVNIGAADSSDAQALYYLAGHKTPNLRWYAATIIGDLIDPPKEAAAVLRRLSEDPDVKVAQLAESALAKS